MLNLRGSMRSALPVSSYATSRQRIDAVSDFAVSGVR